MAAKYRTIGGTRSRTEFLLTLGTVVEKTDEAISWPGPLEEKRNIVQ
jgi:hypothetical protein